MATYNYTITNDFPNGFDSQVLYQEIIESQITIALDNILVTGDNVSVIFKSNLGASDLLILDSIIASHTGETTNTVSTNNILGQEIVETRIPIYTNKIEYLQNSSNPVIPSPYILNSTNPTIEMLNISGYGELRWIITNGSRYDYYLNITIDGNTTKLYCKYLLDGRGINTDTLEDAAPPIYARKNGYIVFRPSIPWVFKDNLSISVERTSTRTISLYGMVEYAIEV